MLTVLAKRTASRKVDLLRTTTKSDSQEGVEFQRKDFSLFFFPPKS